MSILMAIHQVEKAFRSNIYAINGRSHDLFQLIENHVKVMVIESLKAMRALDFVKFLFT